MRVVVTSRRFPDRDPYRDIVEEAGGELVYGDCETESEAVELCRGADVIIGGFTPTTSRVMDAAGELSLIMRHATGYNSVDVQEATARGIPVSNVPGYGSRDVASHAVTLALAASHDVVGAHRRMRERSGWGSPRRLHPIHGGTFGIVGLGRIGRQTVPMARGFGMEVIAHDPYLDTDIFDMLEVERVPFDALLERSDCVSIHTPLTQLTHHLFSDAEFERMRETAVLVNAARGPIVDEEALLDALDNGEIRAAGLDVFEEEPPENSPVLDHDRIVCSPHHGGGSPAAEERVIEMARAELKRHLQGEPLQNVVNPEVYQYRGEQVTRPSHEVETT